VVDKTSKFSSKLRLFSMNNQINKSLGVHNEDQNEDEGLTSIRAQSQGKFERSIFFFFLKTKELL
jgi:hypothetical protein